MPILEPENPGYKITSTFGGLDYVWEHLHGLKVVMVDQENGFPTAALYLAEEDAELIGTEVDEGAVILIQAKRTPSSIYVTKFKGVVRQVTLPKNTNEGERIILHCDGLGWALAEMLCGQEYGTESSNPTLDNIEDIIEDVPAGIIHRWVNRILDAGAGGSSGHVISFDVDTIAGSISMMYFPFKPALKCIRDLCDVVQAIKGTNAGPHFICTPAATGHLMLGTIGAHSATHIAADWFNYYNVTQAESQLTEGVEFLRSEFKPLAVRKNYVLYYGHTIKPIDKDKWMELNAAADWGGQFMTIIDSAAVVKVGTRSIGITTAPLGVPQSCRAYMEPGLAGYMYLNVNGIGGKYVIPIYHLWFMAGSTAYSNNLRWSIGFYSSTAGSSVVATDNIANMVPAANEWVEMVFPIGPYWREQRYLAPTWFNAGANGWSTDAGWDSIDRLRFDVAGNTDIDGMQIWVDGAYIEGYVLRGAKDSTISALNPAKMMLITDHIPKDDSWRAALDTGTIARLAYAELLRQKKKAIVGWIDIPMPLEPTAYPGMKWAVKARPQAGSFLYDKDFRCTMQVDTIAGKGWTTRLHLTDDLTNSITRKAFNDANTMLKYSRPGWQDRQASSMKAGRIDITQTVLEKSY